MASRSPSTVSDLPATCDLVVVGTGAAGLAAAVTASTLGLSVVCLEKDATCGGATAWSGGWMFVPRNPLAHEAGVDEDPALPRTYLEHELGAEFDAARVDAFLDAAPRMVAFLRDRASIAFSGGTWIADIHGRTPGAGKGSRSVVAAPYDAGSMPSELFALLRRPKYETSLFGMGVMAGPDLATISRAMRSPKAFAYTARRMARHVLDVLRSGRSRYLVNGAALVARMMVAGAARGVVFRAGCAVTRLVVEAGTVRGVEVATAKGTAVVRATRGVVLATGGFAHDDVRRARLLPASLADTAPYALPPATVTGDGLALGESAGGCVVSGASAVAWCPVSIVPYRNGRRRLYPHIIDRGKPGIIGVLANGQRFCNEGDGYHDYVSAMIAATPPGAPVVSWLVCDHAFQRRYPFGMAKPFPLPVAPYVRSGYLVRANTLRELAQRCGIDADGFERTVTAFNAGAARGEDPAFGRGSTEFNRRSGDATHTPNPCVAPLAKPPFYAIKVYPGSFGTFAGLAVDVHARVLDSRDQPITGLWAVGNDQASVMGGHYPSGGINLGPAMTFGFVAGCDAAGVDPAAAMSSQVGAAS